MQPSENIKLYCLENYFKELTHLYNDKKMPIKVVGKFEGVRVTTFTLNKGIYKKLEINFTDELSQNLMIQDQEIKLANLKK